MYKSTYRFNENFNVAHFETVGKYDVPILKPCNAELPEEWVGFNYVKLAKNKAEKGLHFYVDDYQFERVWRSPLDYIDLVGKYQVTMTPDFSLYTDFPQAIQIYNHYRKMWLGALWQVYGFSVIPTIAWSDKESFEWCFDGVPKRSIVSVSSVGTQQSKETRKLFLQGWEKMLEVLEPSKVIFHGNIPSECKADIIHIKAYQDKLKGVTVNGW